MASVDWGFICELAYFDSADRLCMLGVEPAGPIPTRLVGAHRMTLVVRLQGGNPDQAPDPAVFVTSPDGDWRVADNVMEFCTETRGEYVLIHMPNMRLHQEGVYRFEVALRTDEPVAFSMSLLAMAHSSVRIRLRDAS